MKNSNATSLNGRPLLDDLTADLGCRVEMANDANCFALAEARLGAGRGAGILFGVILGTGVGGGVVVDGRVLHGGQGIAGEWGHNLLDPGGDPCYCGRRGCVETVLSGPGLERFYEERSGVRRELPEIASRAASGADEAAVAAVERLAEGFGRALASVVNILDPEVVVLGGGGQQRGRPLRPRGERDVALGLQRSPGHAGGAQRVGGLRRRLRRGDAGGFGVEVGFRRRLRRSYAKGISQT